MLRLFEQSQRTLAKLLTAECSSVRARRAKHRIENQDDFAALEAALDIPQAQRSPALRDLLGKLNDAEQSQLWRAHAAQTPERNGIANFFGLAFSGGGIRSATFNLGILQVLAWTKLLNFVDYLSTVSGGGYLGSCVSSLFASPLQALPFEHKPGAREAAVFRHLRNNAEYLAPGGVLDYLRIPMTVFRGMLVNLLTILPYLMIAAILTALMHPTVNDASLHVLRAWLPWLPEFLGDSFIVTKALLGVILVSFVAFPIFYMFFQKASLGRTPDWNLRNKAGKVYAALLLAVGVVAFVELQPPVIHWLLNHPNRRAITLASGSASAVQALIPAALAAWLMKNAEKLAAKYALSLLGLSALVVFWFIYLWMSVWLIQNNSATSLAGLAAPLAAVAALLAYGVFFVDVNHTSVHSFYRDRLSKAYVIKQVDAHGERRLEQNDRQLLSNLNTDDGPYHLINTAVNLRDNAESYKRGRHGESFIFSKHFVGSEPTGYCATNAMESQSRHLNLATAMAISGAAAAPNMGKQTNRLLAFFLAMLNVRLNYWLPNPGHAIERAKAYLPRNPLRRVGPLYLMRELFGLLDHTSRNVNLSDGGHFDNLGLYELFRRECRFIICGDGEADPQLQFNGLAEALRMAQIDFGVIVEMSGLDAVRAGAQNHALGKIRYAGGRIGWLLYLKQSLRGDAALQAALSEARYNSSKMRDDNRHYDDNAYVAEYKARNPDFPHQSTGDQFFDEAQFECTRAVGYAVAYRTLCT